MREGDTVRSTGRLLEVPAGEELLGRVVNPLGQPLDGGPAINASETRKLDIVAPGKTSCPYHFHHAEEEMFIVLQGEGTLRVAGERLPIKAGDVIFIPAGPEYPHHIINTSDAPLHYLSISTQSKLEICEYPDSGKLGAYAPGVRFMQRRETGVDYWDGEP